MSAYSPLLSQLHCQGPVLQVRQRQLSFRDSSLSKKQADVSLTNDITAAISWILQKYLETTIGSGTDASYCIFCSFFANNVREGKLEYNLGPALG